jgi:nitroimidazol reductase NimA-like FMN-containing flavoprotein (pyridoxamine 5'-phosphate oxidase superfamily)
MEVDRNGLEVLERDECLRLLAHRRFGRVGVTEGAVPTILPVNYWCDGASIYVRTTPGTKLDAALRDAIVAFEVDDVDAFDHAGWSVIVTGVAREVTDRAELDRLADAPLPRWAPSPDRHVVAIATELVSGRRLRGMELRPAR